MAERRQIDPGAEIELGRIGRRVHELQQRVEDRDGEGDVIADPQGIVVQALDQFDQLAGISGIGEPGTFRRLRSPVNGVNGGERMYRTQAATNADGWRLNCDN